MNQQELKTVGKQLAEQRAQHRHQHDAEETSHATRVWIYGFTGATLLLGLLLMMFN